MFCDGERKRFHLARFEELAEWWRWMGTCDQAPPLAYNRCLERALTNDELVMLGLTSGLCRRTQRLTSNDLGTLEVLVRMDVTWRDSEIESYQQ